MAKKKNHKEENKWDEFIEAVMAGDVIPVIGSDFLIESTDNPSKNLHRRLIDEIAQSYDIEPNFDSFSQLAFDRNYLDAVEYDKNVIYYDIEETILDWEEKNSISASPLLERLLQIKYFPFVITSSFCPVVEQVMQKQWGEVKVLKFSNDPKSDKRIGEGDIAQESDMKKPTVYYMFGKYSDKPRTYAVTDMDMMDFCSSWLRGGVSVPRNLSEVLKNKYLLVLGNDYSDWLFRFIWYSLRTKDAMVNKSLLVHERIEDSLKSFLDNLQSFVKNDPSAVIEEIERRVKEKEMVRGEAYSIEDHKDVFISYSRRDKDVADELYRCLRECNLKVWYDCEDIEHGDNWRKKIKSGIKKSWIFIPILSLNVIKESEARKEQVYREEWEEAKEYYRRIGGFKFFWPVVENGFSFKNKIADIPEEIQNANASYYDKGSLNFEKLAHEIKETIEKERKY